MFWPILNQPWNMHFEIGVYISERWFTVMCLLVSGMIEMMPMFSLLDNQIYGFSLKFEVQAHRMRNLGKIVQFVVYLRDPHQHRISTHQFAWHSPRHIGECRYDNVRFLFIRLGWAKIPLCNLIYCLTATIKLTHHTLSLLLSDHKIYLLYKFSPKISSNARVYWTMPPHRTARKI